MSRLIDVDVTIIGGGIVGCATAAAVARDGRDVVLLEREPRLATGVTSRNSEVAHGGMYYPPGTLKARCCVRGRRLLKDLCTAAGVGYRECGKLVVAVDEDEQAALSDLHERGLANQVERLSLIGRAELKRLEPEVTAVAALRSDATGILDAEGAAGAYARQARAAGVQVMTDAAVSGLAREVDGWRVTVDRRAGEGWSHRSRWVINCAGLRADEVAALAGAGGVCPRQRWVKGNYFSVSSRHAGRVSRLVYPVPPAGRDTLGVHLCLDLQGQLRLGPDFEPVERAEDYAVEPSRAVGFFAGARRFLPFLEPDDLAPAFSGLRPKIDTDEPFADFQVRREGGDLEGLVNLVGIDSPGLTAAPALAELVAGIIDGGEAPT
ncbi:NAD(P)/FAD-dependent oxidoreductase [bacterium]|nr:NAD(P)/FAD-dependent oxidoreductase [bacterium]MBU1675992.1 NAD(P)/FAD-dependent oxidoreductase [bacterium]